MIIGPVRIVAAAVAASLALVSSGHAQAVETPRFIVRGTVAESGTIGPLAGVSLQLIDSTGQSRALGVSDVWGRFRIDAPGRGHFRVRATRIGFLKAESPFVRVDTGEAFVVFELTRVALLDSVVVTAAEIPLRPMQQLIRGRLLDDDTGDPIENGTIELFDPRHRPVAKVTTSSDGAFRFATPGPGIYSMLGRHVGHRPAEQKDFRMRLGDTVRIEFRLSRNAALLAPALVTASAKPWLDRGDRRGIDDLNERIRRFDGRRHVQFIMRDTIEAYDRRRFDMAAMLDRVVRRSPANGTGCSGDALVIDNFVWRPAVGEPSPLDMFPLSAIELVEHYMFPDIPSEFTASTSDIGAYSSMKPPCSVISVWTRLERRRG